MEPRSHGLYDTDNDDDSTIASNPDQDVLLNDADVLENVPIPGALPVNIPVADVGDVFL